MSMMPRAIASNKLDAAAPPRPRRARTRPPGGAAKIPRNFLISRKYFLDFLEFQGNFQSMVVIFRVWELREAP